MNYYSQIDSDTQNLCALSLRRSTQDGHGGRSAEHRAEMQAIAREIFKAERAQLIEEFEAKILAAQYQAYEQALKDVVRVLEYDIQSVTRIGIEGCRDIFEGKKAQQFLSDKVMQMIAKELKNKSFRP